MFKESARARITALALSLALCAGTFAGCSGGASGSSGPAPAAGTSAAPAASTEAATGERIEISFINGFTGGDGAFMRQITDGFNASQDKYTVVESQEKDHYLKYKSGNYDMVIIHGTQMPTYIMDGNIQEAGALYEQAGLSADDFLPQGMELAQLDGKTYGVPLDIHPLMLFYNKKYAPEPPETLDDLIAMKSELTDPNLYPYILSVVGPLEFIYFNIAGQNSVDFGNEEYLNFATPEFAESLMTFNKMLYTDQVSDPSAANAFGDFLKDAATEDVKQAVVAANGPWNYTASLEKWGDDLGIAPMIQLGDKPGTTGNAHILCVDSRVTDPDKLAGIAAFMQYTFTPENLIHWAEGGQAPVHKATIDLIQQTPEQYPAPVLTISQLENHLPQPQVYQFPEQVRYINEMVWPLVITTPDLTMDQLMAELQQATELAKQVVSQ